MRSLNSAWLLAAPRCTVISEPPPMRKCTWESLNPGRRRRPPRSMMRVSGPASFLIAALLPTARILEPSSATAWAVGCAGFSVHSLALTRIRLASVADALQQQAPSTTMSEYSQESFIATPLKLRRDCPRSRENRGKNISGLYNSISRGRCGLRRWLRTLKVHDPILLAGLFCIGSVAKVDKQQF